MDPEKINALSDRIRAGEEVTDDELREAILSMRSQFDAKPAPKAKAKKVSIDLAALFSPKES